MNYTYGLRSTLTVGGKVFTDLENLIILAGSSDSGVANYTSMWKVGFNSTRGVYQVTAGKTFILHAVRWTQNGTSSMSCKGGLFYGDTDLGENAAGPLTTPKGVITGQAGIAKKGDLFMTDSGGLDNSNQRELAIGGSVPATKYIHFYTNFGGGVRMEAYGYEV